MAVKLDISKAYDQVEWNFLCQMMIRLGFDERWVELAMEIVRIATYSILINGEPKDFVQPSRDDCLLFCEASVEECHRLLDILGRYEAASGQVINRQKTSLFFSRNTKPKVKDAIKNLLGARIMNDCEKYLGLPMMGGKSKVAAFKELQERITKRVMGWKEKFISKAGREILIKTIA
ncbi:uncharacterized protein LOC142617037 [Castanea sativa]|uniref:uncharacterized protein LOC142617037 n=1 Tax=Castanea sativa TaxID=21020 RepID=UPI003F653018